MLQEPTLQKLHALRLGALADAWQTQQRDPKASSLSFDERFAMLVDAEYLARDNRKLARLLKDAELALARADGTYTKVLARRSSRSRRPRAGLTVRGTTTRSARGDGGPIRQPVDRRHQPAPGREMARLDRRSDARRRGSGPTRANAYKLELRGSSRRKEKPETKTEKP